MRKERAEKDNIISSEECEELQQIVISKLKEASQNNSLLSAPKLAYILYKWKKWTNDEEPKKWGQNIVKTDDGLIKILEQFLKKRSSFGLNDVVGKEHYQLDPKDIEPFVDPSTLVDRARKLVDNDGLARNQRLAISTFLSEYEAGSQGQDFEDVRD